MTLVVTSRVLGRVYNPDDTVDKWFLQAFTSRETPRYLIHLQEDLRPLDCRACVDPEIHTTGVIVPARETILVLTGEKPVLVITNTVTRCIGIMSIPNVIGHCTESESCVTANLQQLVKDTPLEQVQVFVGGMKFDECDIMTSLDEILSRHGITICDVRHKRVVKTNQCCWVMIRAS